jgi:very-short-patch-repair endonuclease
MPRQLSFVPFRASVAIADGLLTRRMLRGPSWRRLLPDVYVHTSAELDHRAWCDAVALLLPPGAAIGGLSAAYLWGVDLLPRDAPVAIVIPRAVQSRLRTQPRVSVLRSTLSPADLTQFAALPVTTPLRTAFDVGRRSRRTDAVVAIDALLHRRLVKLDALRGYAADHPGWPGSRMLAAALEVAEPSAESPMETRMRLVIIDGGMPRPTVQHEIRDRHGRFLARVDLAYPQWRVAIEYEGDHHRGRAAFRRDITRLNALREAGWLVLRFTADDVLREPARVVRLVQAAIREPTSRRNAVDVIEAR